MNQDTVVNLASQAMSLALKIAGPLLLVGLVVGLVVSIFQAVTQIQEQSLVADPEDRRRRRRRRAARPLDARPAGLLHDRPVHRDPDDGQLAGRSVNELINKLAGDQLAGLHPRAGACHAAVLRRAAVLLEDDPGARTRHDRRGDLDRPDADRTCTDRRSPANRWRSAGWSSMGCWSASASPSRSRSCSRRWKPPAR